MRRFVWLIGLLAPAILGAQRVRGVVLDSALNSPLSGVVVSVLDSANRVGARTITDASGRFNLVVPATAPKLRLMRIGFRLRDIAIETRDADLTLVMQRIPPILDRVVVSDKEVCPGSPDRSAAFQLWDQVRTGLLATIVARETNPALATTAVYERMLSPSDETVRRQTKRTSRGRTARPFMAFAEPSVFAQFGYMSEDARGRSFYAPDADVLMHESFAATHCFRLRPGDAAHRGQIGVAFTPAPGPGRDTLVDVTGVIWMDDTPQLRSLDFLYTSLEPPAMSARAGGHVEFRTMPNGVSFIERWWLRLPSLQIVTMSRPGSAVPRSTSRTRRADRLDTYLAGIGETRGLVMQADWDDGTSWRDTASIIAGTVKARRSGVPVADAVVFLEGTDDSTRTDVNGEFHIATIPGRYVLRVADTTFGDLVRPRTHSQTLMLAQKGLEMVRVELPAVQDAVNDVCAGQRMRDGTSIIVGNVAMADASRIAGTKIRSAWRGFSGGGSNIAVADNAQEVDVDDDGRFIVCGVEREVPVSLGLYRNKERLRDTTFRIFSETPSHRVLWLVRVDSARPAAVAAVPTQTALVDTASTMSAAEKQDAFQRHAATRLGTYLTDSSLTAGRGRPLVDVLPQLVKTLRVWRTNGRTHVVAPSRTMEIPGFQNVSRCVSDVYVDGVMRWTAGLNGRATPPDLAGYSTDEIAAVEYYAADTRVPDGLRASPCGVLVIWRR